jgi:hypothetical protein
MERRRLTGNKLAHSPDEVKHALEDVGKQVEDAGEEVGDAREERVHNSVDCAEEGGEELVDRGDEVRDGGCDGHFCGHLCCVVVSFLGDVWWCGKVDGFWVGIVLVVNWSGVGRGNGCRGWVIKP